MNLEPSLLALIQTLGNQGECANLKNCIDLTLLDKTAPAESLQTLAAEAEADTMAALCVYPEHIPSLLPTPITLATVINFPSGQETIAECLQSITLAAQLGVQEIDYVADYQSYLFGNKETTLHHCKAIVSLCQDKQLKLKVILETGAFEDLALLFEFCNDIISLGCDFLKTSTGKIAGGASLSSAFILLSAIKASQADCGIKISGGVRTLEQATQYARLAESILGKSITPDWFRIGTSRRLGLGPTTHSAAGTMHY